MALMTGSLFFLMISTKLRSEESTNTHPVISSIERDYYGAFAVNKGEQQGRILGHCSEGFKNEHGSIQEHELNIAWMAGRHGVSWHGNGKLKILHVTGHDRFHIKTNQGVAMEIWLGLSSKSCSQTSGREKNQGWQHIVRQHVGRSHEQ
uniref:Uncharacterized protein n=1 Tax=Romanomermis culicivorax TaxID=13658 RepID=A0A915K6S9_ROMCU